MGGKAPSPTGTGWKRFGPASVEGEARGPQTGSVSTRTPSISSSTVEWPSQVARRPLAGILRQASRGFIDGNGPRGVRRSPPHRNSASVGIGTLGSRSPGSTGCRLRNPAPAQRGEAFMRSRRAPSGFPPRDFMGHGSARARNSGFGAPALHVSCNKQRETLRRSLAISLYIESRDGRAAVAPRGAHVGQHRGNVRVAQRAEERRHAVRPRVGGSDRRIATVQDGLDGVGRQWRAYARIARERRIRGESAFAIVAMALGAMLSASQPETSGGAYHFCIGISPPPRSSLWLTAPKTLRPVWQASQWPSPRTRYAPRFHSALRAGSGLNSPGRKNNARHALSAAWVL